MLELRPCADASWGLGYGGDTLNTAIHLARYGLEVSYLTVMGNDHFSCDLIETKWPAEGLNTRLILIDTTRQPGLYAITNDEHGERSFTYWRDNSAVKRLFSHPDIGPALDLCLHADILYYSLITLAILPVEGRLKMFELCRRFRRRGGLVAFDGNYRPKLWDDAASAVDARDAAIRCSDIGLPTFADETLLSGARDANEVASHWQSLGCREVIVKLGEEGCMLPDRTIVSPHQIVAPIDTSGAGDAFNAGYLCARTRGSAVEVAAAEGHRLAGWVVTQSGAIPTRVASAPYS